MATRLSGPPDTIKKGLQKLSLLTLLKTDNMQKITDLFQNIGIQNKFLRQAMEGRKQSNDLYLHDFLQIKIFRTFRLARITGWKKARKS